MLAAIDFHALGQVIWVSFVAGTGVTVLFSVVISGLGKAAEARRAGNGGATVGYVAIAVVAALLFAALVVIGVAVMLNKDWSRPGYSIVRSTFAGEPAAIERGGRSVVTTELAPITQRSPIVTPLVTTTLAPHQTLSPT